MTDYTPTDADFLASKPAQVPVGTHPAIITGITPVELDTKFGAGQRLFRWDLTVTLKDGTDVELDGLTGRELTPRAKLTKWSGAAGLTGDAIDVRKAVGQAVLVVVAEDDQGYTDLVDIVAAP